MKFSIIIPTYNRANFICNTIQSVLNNSYKNFEIIIVDDGSSDNTEEVVLPFLNNTISYFKIVNSERAFARNYGTSMAKGDYVVFLDSDDLLYNNHLKSGFDFITKNNFPEWFFCGYDIIDSSTNSKRTKLINLTNLNKKLIEGNFLCCQSIFIKRQIALENKFNSNRALSSLEDWELWLRLATKYKLYYSNTITSALIQHDARSVMDFNQEKLINKFMFFREVIFSNEEIQKYYKGSLYKFKSSCNSYIALHLALSKKNRFETIKYLIISVYQNPLLIFKRRFLAIIKHFI